MSEKLCLKHMSILAFHKADSEVADASLTFLSRCPSFCRSSKPVSLLRSTAHFRLHSPCHFCEATTDDNNTVRSNIDNVPSLVVKC